MSRQSPRQNYGDTLAQRGPDAIKPLLTGGQPGLGLDGPLPLPPPELGESELAVDYVTPIGQAQKAVQVESMARVIEGVERLSAFDRALPGIVDAEAAVREIADIYNAPMDMLQAPEAVAVLRRRQAEAAEAQQAASLGAERAGAVKDLAQAARVVGGG